MHGIAAQVALGEIGEGSRHHSPHLGAIQVRMYERRERRQETVGIRLAVDPADDLLIGQPMRREEFLPQGDMPFENTVHQVAPHRRTAALVAEDITQRRDVFHDFTAPAPARIGARAEDAGHAFATAEQRPRSPQQVGLSLDMSRTEMRAEFPHHLLRRFGKGAPAPCAVEIDGLDGIARRQFSKRFAYLLRGVLHGIDSPRPVFRGMHAVGQEPRTFCRSAVCNDFHVDKDRKIIRLRKAGLPL